MAAGRTLRSVYSSDVLTSGPAGRKTTFESSPQMVSQIWKLCADFYYMLSNAELARFSSLGNVFIGSLAFAIVLAGLFTAGALPLWEEDTMENCIHREILAILKKKLAETEDEARRRVILKLLAEEEAKVLPLKRGK